MSDDNPSIGDSRRSAMQGRLLALLDSLETDWRPVSDNVAVYLLCGAGLVELRLLGRAWTSRSALDFEATACGVWIDAEHRSILPDEIRHAVPAWGGLAVAVQLKTPVYARLTTHGQTCRWELRDAGPELFLEYVCSHPIRGRVVIRTLGNEGPAPGAAKADDVTGDIVKELEGIKQAVLLLAREAPAPAVAPDPAPKKSTERGDARAKLIAALTKHHQYADGSCLNLEPIGNNELAKAADVSASTASAFFNDKFQGHTKYTALCRDAGKLAAALKLLNDEFAPYHLLGAASSDVAAPEQDDADSES